MRKIEVDEQLLIKLYVENSLSGRDCAKILKVSESCVSRKLRKLGINVKSIIEPKKIDEKQVIDLYWKQGLTLKQTAEKLGRSIGLINRILKDSDTGTRNCSIAQEKYNGTDQINDDILTDLYINQQKSLIEIGKDFNTTGNTIKRKLKKLNIKIRKPWEQNKKKNIPTKEIIDLYWNKNLSLDQISQKIKIGKPLIRQTLVDSGKGLRTIGDGHSKFYKTDNIDNQKLISMYNKQKMSCDQIAEYFNITKGCVRLRLLACNQKLRENIGENNPSWKGGITEIADMVRHGANYINWRTNLFEKYGYKSQISKIGGHLHCHHIVPFSVILKTVETKHKPLDGHVQKLAIYHDKRFYDENNGLIILESEHNEIEKFDLNGYPWWRIWKAFPEYALNNSSLTENDMLLFDDCGKIDASKSILLKGQRDDIKDAIKYEHYLGTIPNASTILIAKTGNIITGIATFGRGANKNLDKNILELTRLCIPFYVVRPYGSTFINLCINYIRNNMKDINTLVSYADTSVGHNGGIYRMSGWQKAGKTSSSYSYFDPSDNQLKHKSCCRRIKNVDKSEKQLAEENGLIKIPLPPKYRYIYNLY
jgi:predicted DNA-binding protein YlxM (UPF0122 family)